MRTPRPLRSLVTEAVKPWRVTFSCLASPGQAFLRLVFTLLALVMSVESRAEGSWCRSDQDPLYRAYGEGCGSVTREHSWQIWISGRPDWSSCWVGADGTELAWDNADSMGYHDRRYLANCAGGWVGSWPRYVCKAGYHPSPADRPTACVHAIDPADLPKKWGRTCPVVGNPIDPATGNKVEFETDYVGIYPLLRVERTYNSVTSGFRSEAQYVEATRFGSHWIDYYDRRIPTNVTSEALVWREDGKRLLYTKSGSVWLTDSDTPDKLIPILSGSTLIGWTLKLRDGSIETYDATGGLSRIDEPSGYYVTLNYAVTVPNGGDGDSTTLDTVTDRFGRQLKYHYTAAKFVDQITLPDTAVLAYAYAEDPALLQSVTFPDATPGTPLDNPKRIYLYGEPANMDNTGWPGRLTGLMDENGQRYGSWGYDSQGRAKYAYHGAQSTIDRVDLAYGAPGAATTVTDALGLVRNYTYSTITNDLKISGLTGGPCATCGGATQATTYDANGFVSSETDFLGNKILSKHDAMGLKTCQVESVPGAGQTPAYRRILKTWDTTLRVPTAIQTYEPVNPTMGAPTVCDDVPGSSAWTLRKEELLQYVSGKALVDIKTERHWPVNAAVPDRITDYNYYSTAAGDPAVLDGLVKSVDGPRAGALDTTTFDYRTTTIAGSYRAGDLWKITNALGQVTEILTTDANGRPTSIKDPNNAMTTLTYHPRGWLASRTLDGQTTAFTYDNVGQLDRVTLPGGAYIDYDYDAAHRLTDIKDNLNNLIHYTLDAMGNHTGESTKDPAGVLKRQIDRVYNIKNQIEKLTVGGASGQVTAFSQYDLNGNLETTIDQRDPNPVPTNLTPTIYTKNTYDALSRVREVRNTMGLKTKTTFDVFDNPTGITPELSTGVNGPPTTYTNSAFGDVLTEASSDAGNSFNKYDSAGNRLEHTDGRSITTTYAYDALNRLATVNYPSATQTDIFFTYDQTGAGQNGKGRLTTMTDEAGATAYKYDLRGNVTEMTVSFNGGPQSKTLTFGYDGADRVISIGYPSGRTVNLSRDTVGRVAGLSSVQFGVTKALASNVAYVPFGTFTGFTYGSTTNTLTYSKTLDLSYRPTALTETGVLGLSYAYENAGKSDDIDTLNDAFNANSNQSFDYDNLSRVTTASNTGGYGTQSYLYNGIGNRTSQTLNGAAAQAYSYSIGTNRLSSVATGPTFSYDNAGNAITRSGVPLTYDDGGRLSTVNNGTTASYLQNGRGERVKKTAGGQTLYSLYGLNGELLAELNSSGSVIVEYAYLEEEPVAMMTPENPTGDADGDGMINGWEEQYGLNPNSAADASLDSDNDGLTNLQEFQAGTEPTKADTDGDGLLDGADPTPLVNSAAWLVPLQQMLQ